MARFVFVTRDLSVTGGGIGLNGHSRALAVAGGHDVTVVADAASAVACERLAVEQSAIRWITADSPAQVQHGFYSAAHEWSARACETLRELARENGPADYIEFADYLGQAAVTLQAAGTADPLLAGTRIGVRLCTTLEICDVLNGAVPDELERVTVYDMERYALANADCLTHIPQGDVIGAYRRFYGEAALAPARPVGHVISAPPAAAPPPPPDADLRLLYVGRLERRKGVLELVEALSGCDLPGWRLTIAGADTQTATLETSIRAALLRASAHDPRITLLGELPHEAVGELMHGHDAVISPSAWECGPNVVIEALAANRPVLATPVGGQSGFVIDGDCGMLAGGCGAADLLALVARAIDERGLLAEMVDRGAPARRYAEIADPAACGAALEEIVELPASPAPDPGRPDPTISAVIPYHLLHATIEQTVDSLQAQQPPPDEIVIVNDGSFVPADDVLDRLAGRPGVRVLNKLQGGPSAARNFGVRQSWGEFVLLIDGDDVLRPGFTRRAIDTLVAHPDTAYVVSWFRYVDEDGRPSEPADGYHPLGNTAAALDASAGVAGGSCALLRRAIFDEGFSFDSLHTGSEDTLLWRTMRARGRFGRVIPERLLDYRIRRHSNTLQTRVPNVDRVARQQRAAVRGGEMTWTAV